MSEGPKHLAGPYYYGDWVHTKPDNTSYTYVGRSYGVGSAAGLEHSLIPKTEGIQVGSKYSELGYWTDIECWHNMSSAFQVTKEMSSSSSSYTTFQAGGELPNSDQALTPYVMFASGNNNKSVGWATDSSNQEHILAIAVGGEAFRNLSQIQCSINFTSTNFYVYINDTSGKVWVTRGEAMPQVSFAQNAFDPDGRLANTAISQLGLISQFRFSPYSSDLGNALHGAMQANAEGISFLNETEQLSAIANALTIALDDILGYIGASQFAQNSMTSIPYEALVQRVKFGENGWVYCVMIVTAVLCVLAIARVILRFCLKKPARRHPITRAKTRAERIMRKAVPGKIVRKPVPVRQASHGEAEMLV